MQTKYTPEQRKEKFLEIKAEFDKLDKSRGSNIYDTAKGIFAFTPIERIFNFFELMHLDKNKRFMDLGCGDGRVVLVASLFTEAQGIEFDKDLVKLACKLRDKLDLDAEIEQGDYLEIDLRKFDFLYINPDHDLKELDKKLSKELKGTIYIQYRVYSFSKLKKGRTFWIKQTPFVSYTRD